MADPPKIELFVKVRPAITVMCYAFLKMPPLNSALQMEVWIKQSSVCFCYNKRHYKIIM